MDNKKLYFNEVFDSHYEKIVSFLCHYCRDREEAEDIAQDTFISFWDNIDKIDRDMSPAFYLFRIAKNKALNSIRKKMVEGRYSSYVKKREDEVAYKALSSLTMEQVQADDLRRAVDASLLSMNPNTAETFRLSRFDGMKNAEVARKQHVSVKTVEYRLQSALRVLRANLKEFLALFIFLKILG